MIQILKYVTMIFDQQQHLEDDNVYVQPTSNKVISNDLIEEFWNQIYIKKY